MHTTFSAVVALWLPIPVNLEDFNVLGIRPHGHCLRRVLRHSTRNSLLSARWSYAQGIA
jgi:hypothetical protein